MWFCLCDCFNHPPGVSISFPATLPLLVRIHWKQGRRREQTPWDNDFPPSQAGGSRRRRSPVPAPQAALAMEKKHQRQGTPQVRQELFLGPVCSFRLSPPVLNAAHFHTPFSLETAPILCGPALLPRLPYRRLSWLHFVFYPLRPCLHWGRSWPAPALPTPTLSSFLPTPTSPSPSQWPWATLS